MMSDDPYIMRQDPLTQLPLCPSAARKPRLISPILIHHLSAVVCFGHTESHTTGWNWSQWSVLDVTSRSTVSEAQSIDGRWWRGDRQWESWCVWQNESRVVWDSDSVVNQGCHALQVLATHGKKNTNYSRLLFFEIFWDITQLQSAEGFGFVCM